MISRAPSSNHDAIVIGSGFGGLTCALILARHGWNVLVLESHYRPGGYLQRFRRKGTRYDTGFHYTGALGKQQVLAKVLRYIGIEDKISAHPLDPDGFDHLKLEDGFVFRVPYPHEAFVERLCETFPRDADACRRYVREMRETVARFPLYSLSMKEPETTGLLEGPTLREYLEALTDDRRLRNVLAAQGVLYGVRSADAPLAVHMLVLDSFLQSAWGIDGGGEALAEAAVTRLRELGSEVRTRSPVTAIEVDDNRNVTGVVVRGEERIATPVVIATCHPKVMLELVPRGRLRPAYRHRIADLKDGVGTFGIYVTTSADLSGFGAHNVYRLAAEDVDDAYGCSTAAPGREPSIFYTVPSARDPRHAGAHVIVGLSFMWHEQVSRWAGSRPFQRDVEYDTFKLETAAGMISVLERELPEIRDHILTVEASTPLTNEHYTGNAGGAAYGIYHDRNQAMFAVNPRTRVKGLLLSGHSVMLPGIIGVGLTAFITCAHLLDLQELRQGLIDA